LPASLTILGGVIAIGGVVISSLWGKARA
jgi:hypothetical protein